MITGYDERMILIVKTIFNTLSNHISYLALNVVLVVTAAIQMAALLLMHLRNLDNDLNNLQPLCNLVLLLPQNLPMNWMHL